MILIYIFKGFKEEYINPDDWKKFDGDWLKFFTSTCGRINIELHNTSDLYRCFTEITYSQEEVVLSTELYHFNNASYEPMNVQWKKNYNLGTWFYSAIKALKLQNTFHVKCIS